ncbi:hypothetical protein CVT26_008594 [Gymnopilus dilepis]|uniref:GST N-terminal domain-containing protein n=1 Tax=Gymnopilus dilepis TaxID=231916 RepID=A0A409XXU9_9AGAR|nr:hypothetical protein CVT26_008594 [Gymnopilus dilepis]
MTIIFYDVLSDTPGKAWSANTWKVRLALNIKGIPYRTEWVEFKDVQEHCKKLGIPPTSTNADGTPFYTLPAIHDPSTGAYLSESIVIVEYLEETYPNTTPLLPNNTHALQVAMIQVFRGYLTPHFWMFSVPAAYHVVTPASKEYFRQTREQWFGKTLEDLLPKGDRAVEEWGKFKDGLGKVDNWYSKNGGKGPFILGEIVSWADIFIAGYFCWMKVIWGEDSREWRDVMSWHGGRWQTLMESLDKFMTIH